VRRALREHLRGRNRKLGKAAERAARSWYCSSDVVRMTHTAGHLTRIGEDKCVWGTGENPEGRKPLGNRQRKWKGKTEMDLKETAYD
jgi:hypothetical protein